MRKFFFNALIFPLIFLLLTACAYADVAIYRGTHYLGAIKTSGNDEDYSVSVEDFGKLLGFTASRSNEELLLDNGKLTIRVILESAAALCGYSIISLSSPPVERNGKFWIDSPSALILFQNAVGSGQENRLRFNKVSAEAMAKSEIDFGTFNIPENKPAVTQSPKAAQASTVTAKAQEVSQTVTAKTQEVSQTVTAKTQEVSQTVTAKAPEISEVSKAETKAQELTQAQKAEARANEIIRALTIAAKPHESSQAQSVTAKTSEISEISKAETKAAEIAQAQKAEARANEIIRALTIAAKPHESSQAQSVTAKAPEVSQAVTAKAQEVSQVVTAKAPEVSQVVTAKVPEVSQAVTAKAQEVSQAVTAKVPEVSQAVTAKVPEVSQAVTAKVPEVSQAVTAKAQEVSQAVTAKAPEVSQTPRVTAKTPTITHKTLDVSQLQEIALEEPEFEKLPMFAQKIPDVSQLPILKPKEPEITAKAPEQLPAIEKKAPAISSKTPENSQIPDILQEFPALSKLQSPQIHTSSVKVSSKTQPKIETFRPNMNQKKKAENYNGIINSISWSSQDGTKQKKIRAIFEVNEDASPQVFMSGGVLHALFKSGPESIKVPYSNVAAEIKRNSNGLEVLFTPKDIIKAEKFLLDNPPRVVFTFTFPKDVVIAENKLEAQEQILTANIPEQKTQPAQNIIPEIKPDESPRKKSSAKSSSIKTNPETSALIAQLKRKTIVIDPGHGGKDPGASANGVTEKDVNLGIGLELEQVLTSKGHNVIMTRNNDTYLKLQERTDIANNANADLFVSIHVNALPNKKSMTGFEIYIMALPTDKDAMNLAKIENREYVEGKGMDTANVDRRTEMLLHILGDMQQNNKISESTDFAAALYNAGARNGLPMRRVAQAPFFVLRGAGMPAVLIETGFVTNDTEAKKLATSTYQRQIAIAMAEGIANYLK